MARIKKYSPEQNLSSFQTLILDENPNSDYFRISEFKDTFTGGKNGFLIEGSEYLKESTEIKIELLDVEGNPIYFEPGNGIPEYYEGISKLIAVYIYNDTPIGLGKITVLGELKKYDDNGVIRDVPDQWKGTYNVKWERTFQINQLLSNEDKVRFYRRPKVTIDEIVKPIFSGNPPSVTQTGSVDGIPLVPLAGSNVSDFILPTSYRLKVNSGNKWTGSVEGEKITFDNITYSPTIEEIVNETEIIVSPPYAEDNIVTSFTNEDYSVEFPYIEGVGDLATALTGSFAKISITDMKTFVGDAARVKIFRRSQNNLTDFEFVQEIQLESNELLRDITTFAKKEEPYGFFSQAVLDDYWATSSIDFDVTFNQNFLYNSAKLNSTPTNYFFTSESFAIQSGVEYTLDLNVRKETTDVNAYLKVFLSGSYNGKGVEQQIANIPSTAGILQKTNFSENIVANNFDNAELYFEVSGSDWYVNNISLKASQETSFSPDEITFIQQVPKLLVEETFDYRFEFYDINNNYIPITVEDTKTFSGGNTNLFEKSIELTPQNLYFSFDSASSPANAVPPLTIAIDVDTTLVTGSITYTSGAYDFFGNLLSSSQYVGGIYPGYLTNWDVDGGREPFLRVQDFTGSRDDISVQFIRYTGAIEGVSDTFVISRVEDGKGGVSFEIVPFRGVQIKNKESKTLEIQAVRVDGINRINLRAGLDRGFSDAKLHLLSSSLDGTTEVNTYVSLSQAITNSDFIEGVSVGTTGSGEIDYNAIFDRDAIDNELTVYLMDGPTSESILTSQILTDLKDGLNPGLITSTADQFNIKYKPREAFSFDPSQIIVTSSFQQRGSTLNPLTASLVVKPSASIQPLTELPELFVFYDTGAFDDTITVAVTNVVGDSIDSGFPGISVPYYTATQTKQLNFEFTYTEPVTSASVTANKTFFITPDGLPGQDSIVIDIDPNPISLGSNHKGEVYNYSLADTDVQVTQGDLFLINTGSGNPGTFTTTSVVPTNIVFETLVGDSTTTMSLAGFETMSALSASVQFDFNIFPYFTASLITASKIQKFTKIVDGGGPIEVTLDPIATALNADEVGFVSNYSSATTEVFIKQDDEFFFYDEFDGGRPGTFVTESITQRNIQFSEVSSSFRDLSVSGSISSSGGEILHFKGFGGLANNQPSASITYNFKVYPYSLTGGVAGIPRIVSKTQTFSKVNDGTAARKVSLVASSDVVVYNGDGIKVAPSGDVQLSATAINVTGSSFFTFLNNDGSTIQASSTNNSTTVGDLPATGSTKTFTVELRDGLATGPIVDTDSVTISGVGEGSTAYSAQLSNPASSVTVEVDGTTFFQNSGTLIRAYKGGSELQYVEEYDEEAVDPITFLPIGTFGQFSASIEQISSFLTQGTLRDSKEIVSSSGELYGSASAITNWTTPQSNTQGSIIYKIDFENGRATQFVQQSFSTVFEGATGPGIVMRGEWTGSIPYIFDQGNQRRDAVLRDVSGTTHYWATTQLVPSGSEYTNGDDVYTIEPILPSQTNPDGTYVEGTIDTNGWEYLGEQELFVAAKIAIFDESFVKNTINVGQPTTDYDVNPQIAIVGGTDEPFISIGQSTQGYGKKGAYIGVTKDGGPASSEGGLLSLSGDETAASFNALKWDGEVLTIRGALRQTAAGGREGTLQGLWSSAAGTFEYVVNDIVSHAGKSWVCILQHTKNTSGSEPLNGGSYTTYWEIAADAGTSGTAGTAGTGGATAKTIRLSSTAQAFVKPKDSADLTPSSITLTTNRQNIASTSGFTSSPSVTLSGTGDTRTLSNTDFGSNTAVTITATADGLSDEITIVKVEEGSDAITIVNTNQSHTVPASSAGVVSSFAGSGTKIEVYEGATKLDYDGGLPPSDGAFSIGNVVITPNVQLFAGDFTIDSTPDEGADYIEYGDGTAMDNATDVVTIRYGITGSRANGEEFRADTLQTIAKSKAGSDGAAGEAAGIVYAGEWKLTLPDGSTPDTTNKVVYLGEDDLKYVVKYTSGASNYWVSATTHRYCGTSTGGNVVGDVVLFSGNYYIANKSTADDPQGEPADWDSIGMSVANITPGGTPLNGYTLWESFGAEFTSVATDILFAQDVYADKTVNIGSNDGSPVISLNADAPNNENPFISIGQGTQGFGEDGIFMGYDGGNTVLSFVSESSTRNAFFIYESGSIQLSDANFGGTGSVIEGARIQIGANSSNVNNFNFTVDTDGNMSASLAYISGSVNAADGRIGNWIIDPIVNGEGGVLRDNDSEIVLEPNIPEIQIFSGSVQKVKIGSKGQLSSIEALGDDATWSSNPSFAATNVGPSTISGTSTNIYTATTGTTGISVSTGDYLIKDINWPQLNYTAGTDMNITSAGNHVYPNYTPSYAGQMHGGFFISPTPRNRTFILYLEMVDKDNSDALVKSVFIGSKYIQGSIPTQFGYVATSGGGQSVVGTTEITLENGTTKLAKDITLDDRILAWDSDTEKWVSAQISKILKRNVSEIYKVTIDGREIEVSESHGFWLFGNEKNSGQIRASELYKNRLIPNPMTQDILKLWVKDGDSKKKVSITNITKIEKEEEVITFSVPKYVNYISNNIISHNVWGSLNWNYQDIGYGGGNAATAAGNFAGGSNQEKVFAVNGSYSNVGFRYRLYLQAQSGRTYDVSSSGVATSNESTHTLNFAQTTNSGIDIYFSSNGMETLTNSVYRWIVDRPSNFVEIQPGGIQVVTSADIFVKARRRDSVAPTNAADAFVFFAEGGTSQFSSLGSQPYFTAITVDGDVIPYDESGTGPHDLGANSSTGKWNVVWTNALNSLDTTNLGVSKTNSITGTTGQTTATTARSYVKLPGGVICQWGSIQDSSNPKSVSFPTQFPNSVSSVVCSTIRSSAGGGGYNHVYNIDRSGCDLILDNQYGFWMAWGH